MRIQYLYHRHVYPIINGTFLTSYETALPPKIFLPPGFESSYMTLILHDPDAVGGNKIHWLVMNIPGDNLHGGDCVFSYVGPHPPKGTGIHHYYFLLLKQKEKNMILPFFPTRHVPMKALFQVIKGSLVDHKFFTSSYSEEQLA